MDEQQLFATRNSFYAGDYNTVLTNLEPHLKSSSNANAVADEIIYLLVSSYIALAKYPAAVQALQSPTASSINQTLKESLSALVKFKMTGTFSGPSDFKVNRNDASSSFANNKSCVAMGLIQLGQGNLEEAFKILTQHNNDLECLSLIAHIYLRLGKVELATGELEKAKNIDEESFVTVLTDAMIRSYKQGGEEKEALNLYQDIAEYQDLTGKLLVGLATCNLIQGKVNEAERQLSDAISKSQNDSDALANLVVATSLASKSKPLDASEKLFNQLAESHPNHPFVKDVNGKSKVFDDISRKLVV